MSVMSCITEDFNAPEQDCRFPDNSIPLSDLAKRSKGELVRILDTLSMKGYVVSSQSEGQFYGKLILQDREVHPTIGISIETDAAHTELLAPKGSRVAFDLKGLYIQNKDEKLRLGGVFPSFGNLALGRIPVLDFNSRIHMDCNTISTVEPTIYTLKNTDEIPVNTLVEFDSIFFKDALRNTPFTVEDGDRFLAFYNCKGDSLYLKVSSFSQFAKDSIPAMMGTVQGVYQEVKGISFLEMRSIKDLQFSQVPCEILPEHMSSNRVFISEIADPKNNTKARFIELYNAGDTPVKLNDWELIRYTNANTSPSHRILFMDQILAPKETLVIASNRDGFLASYGFLPDLSATSNSAAGSNGDDNIVLIDPFGAIIDIFGVVGEDGTGTNHDFEDGRVVRILSIDKANPMYHSLEWMITKEVNAPGGFNPGSRD